MHFKESATLHVGAPTDGYKRHLFLHRGAKHACRITSIKAFLLYIFPYRMWLARPTTTLSPRLVLNPALFMSGSPGAFDSRHVAGFTMAACFRDKWGSHPEKQDKHAIASNGRFEKANGEYALSDPRVRLNFTRKRQTATPLRGLLQGPVQTTDSSHQT